MAARFLDDDGSHQARIAAQLERAVRPLRRPWVRSFLLELDNTAANVSMLASPLAIAQAPLFSSCFRLVNGLLVDMHSSESDLFIPCVTVDDYVVGLCIQVEGVSPQTTGTDKRMTEVILSHWGEKPIHLVGRFGFSYVSGELLMISRLMDEEIDPGIPIVESMMSDFGIHDPESIEFARSRELLRVTWSGPVQGRRGRSIPLGLSSVERLQAYVDKDMFLARDYEKSFVFSVSLDNCVRNACTECTSRALSKSVHSSSATIPAEIPSCACRKETVPARSLIDHSVCERNMRTTSGFWTGSSTIVMRAQTWKRPAMVALGDHKFAIDATLDSELTSRLQTLVIQSSLSKVDAKRHLLPGIFGRGAEILGSRTSCVDSDEAIDFDGAPKKAADDVVEQRTISSIPPVQASAISSTNGFLDRASSHATTGICAFGTESNIFQNPLIAYTAQESPESVEQNDTSLHFRGGPSVVPAILPESRELGLEFDPGIRNIFDPGLGDVHTFSQDGDVEASHVAEFATAFHTQEADSEENGVSHRQENSMEDEGVQLQRTKRAKTTDERTKEERLEERKRRNRECAARSNLRRKQRNDYLKASIREAKHRLLELSATEMELRKENVELRRRIQLSSFGKPPQSEV